LAPAGRLMEGRAREPLLLVLAAGVGVAAAFAAAFAAAAKAATSVCCACTAQSQPLQAILQKHAPLHATRGNALNAPHGAAAAAGTSRAAVGACSTTHNQWMMATGNARWQGAPEAQQRTGVYSSRSDLGA
jgi:hypothetical protein